MLTLSLSQTLVQKKGDARPSLRVAKHSLACQWHSFCIASKEPGHIINHPEPLGPCTQTRKPPKTEGHGQKHLELFKKKNVHSRETATHRKFIRYSRKGEKKEKQDNFTPGIKPAPIIYGVCKICNSEGFLRNKSQSNLYKRQEGKCHGNTHRPASLCSQTPLRF